MNHSNNNNKPNLYLVTGATGQIGGHIVTDLLKKGRRVGALTRNPEKVNFPEEVDVVSGDLNKPETVASAFEGVTGVHFITINGEGFGPLESAPELVRLAEEAGVKRVTVLWNGVPGPVEDAVKASRLEWTILQPQEFMSNAIEWKDSIRKENVAIEAFGHRRTAYIHPADIASVAVAALTQKSHAGKELVLTGPEVLSPAKAVQIIAGVTGKQIRFEERSEAEERRRMKEEHGLEQEMIDYVISWTKNPPPEAYTISPVVEEVTGHLPRTFRQWAEENADEFK
ncbi:MAG: NAD(P)H-binding protein [Balneolaceae bacterium]|nr:NAD(P)H-binding protein [Balneolaceae bacterium]